MKKVQRITIKHSNPSLGPHNKKRSYTIDMNDREELAADLLTNTTVNGVMSLGEYLAAKLTKDTEVCQVVDVIAEDTELGHGSTISDLVFEFEGGISFTLHDLRKYNLQGSYRDTFLPVLIAQPVQIDSDELDKHKGTHKPGADDI